MCGAWAWACACARKKEKEQAWRMEKRRCHCVSGEATGAVRTPTTPFTHHPYARKGSCEKDLRHCQEGHKIKTQNEPLQDEANFL